MQKKILILALILYIISAASAFSALSFFNKDKQSQTSTQSTQQEETEPEALAKILDIDPNAPKTEVCPLNGKKYTVIEREAWEKRRPLFVMVENHPDARPQSGLSSADIVFEALAEGGVTRFGVVYYCGAQSHDVTIAPVRSARTYFVDWAAGFNQPIYVHVGGANVSGPSDALGQIRDYGWNLENDMNLGFTIGYPTYYKDYNRLDHEVATEHTGVSSTERLWKVAEERGWTNMSPEQKIANKVIPGTDWKAGFESWVFEEETKNGNEVLEVSYDFWSDYNDYSVKWTYDPERHVYLRTMGGQEHLDLNNNQRIAANNVVVLLATEKGPINEKKHLLYGTIGQGKALIFKDGQVIEATWTKPKLESPLLFVDAKGKAVEMARGLTWISVINKLNEVKY